MLLQGLTTDWPITAWILIQVIFWAVFTVSIVRLDLNHLKHFGDTGAWAASLIFFTLLWRLSAGIEPGLSFHIFGSALLTLLFGFPYMLLGGVLGMIANALSGVGTIVDIPASALAVLIIPGGTTFLVWKLSLRLLPPNFFAYVWGCGFFGATLGIAVSATAITTLLWVSGLYPLDYLLDFYFPYALMQTFPEGLITGTVLALLVVHKPEWVATFHDEFYLHHRHPRDAHHLPKRRSSDD